MEKLAKEQWLMYISVISDCWDALSALLCSDLYISTVLYRSGVIGQNQGKSKILQLFANEEPSSIKQDIVKTAIRLKLVLIFSNSLSSLLKKCGDNTGISRLLNWMIATMW